MADEAEKREEYVSRGPVVQKVRKRRKDGWTKREMKTFLEHLRATSNIDASAAAVGKSPRSARNLRDRDAAFAADWREAMDEAEPRLQSKLIVHTETGGKIPPPRDDGEPAEAPPETFDPYLALQLLSCRRARGDGYRPKGGPRPKCVEKEELVQVMVKLLRMLTRRRANLAQ